jgi:hypothetical protein
MINRNAVERKINEVAGNRLCSKILLIYAQLNAGFPEAPPTSGKIGK